MGSEEYKERGEEGYSGRTVRFDAYVRLTIGIVLEGGDTNATSRISRHVQRVQHPEISEVYHRFFLETPEQVRLLEYTQQCGKPDQNVNFLLRWPAACGASNVKAASSKLSARDREKTWAAK